MFNGLDVEAVFSYFETYDVYFLFIVMFLEHLNVPGLPAGIIMPAVGFLVSQGSFTFWYTIFIASFGGLLGSIALFGIGYYFGHRALDWLSRKSKRMRTATEKLSLYFDQHGDRSVFFTRLIPVVRTLISLVAGVTRLNIRDFILYSALGIFIWNTFLISLGYFFGSWILNL